MFSEIKIVHITSSTQKGGAAVATNRLHEILGKLGINSKVLAGVHKGNDLTIIKPIKRSKLIDKILSKLTSILGFNYLGIYNTFFIPNDSFFRDADIINFHNLHGAYFNYLALPYLTKLKPAVFTLHDIWSFTGHCAYNWNYECNRWKSGCYDCPSLNVYPKIYIDNAHLEWTLKANIYKKSNLDIVVPSQWLQEQVQKSMLKNLPLHYIPHGLDLDIYKPLNKEQCRRALNIPADHTILLFSAHNLKSIYKGGDLLLQALTFLPEKNKEKLVLLTLGDSGNEVFSKLSIPTISLGYVFKDTFKAQIYSASDIFVFPTRADIFGLVLQESMACGTPLVSFNVGGVSELVRSGITGYLAEPEDPQDLCNGIVQLLEDKALRKKMSANCRRIAEAEYSIELQAQRYIELYQQILQRDRNSPK